MSISWNTGLAAARVRFKKNKKRIRLQAPKRPSGWARPIKNQVPSSKLDRSRALGYNGIMKTIKYKNKTIKLPFADADYGLDPLEEVTIKNRFSGQATTMPAFAAAVYDVIIGAEMMEQWDLVRKGLDWFKQYFAKQYMVVLD